MKFKILAPVAILIVSYQVGEMHTLFDWRSEVTHNWIWLVKRPMNYAWNVKFLSEEVCRLLEAVAALLTVRMLKPDQVTTIYKTLFITWQTYLVYRSLDIGFYFLSYKTDYYNWIWVMLGVVEFWLSRKFTKRIIFTTKAG